MNQKKSRIRQVVDWRAAIWAGVFSGIIFLALSMLLSWIYIGSPWVIVRLVASVVMGTHVLPPPASFAWSVFLVALPVHLLLSILFAGVIAVVLHRWGLIVGILGGALFGLAFYLINFYTVSYFFPWFFPMRSWIMAAGHLAFGACAGGLYEAMEVEEFVPVEAGT